MYFMLRRLFILIAFSSFILSIGVGVLWYRSFRVFDYVSPVTIIHDKSVLDCFIQSGMGGMAFCLQVQEYVDPDDMLARKSDKKKPSTPFVHSDSRPTRYPGTKVSGELRNYAPPPPKCRWDAYGFAVIHKLDYAHGNHTVQDYARRELDRIELWGRVAPDWFVLLLVSLPFDFWLARLLLVRLVFRRKG